MKYTTILILCSFLAFSSLNAQEKVSPQQLKGTWEANGGWPKFKFIDEVQVIVYKPSGKSFVLNYTIDKNKIKITNGFSATMLVTYVSGTLQGYWDDGELKVLRKKQ